MGNYIRTLDKIKVALNKYAQEIGDMEGDFKYKVDKNLISKIDKSLIFAARDIERMIVRIQIKPEVIK